MSSAAMNMSFGEFISLGCTPSRENIGLQGMCDFSINRCCQFFTGIAPVYTCDSVR